MKVGLVLLFLLLQSGLIRAQFFSGTFHPWEEKNKGGLKIDQRKNNNFKLEENDSVLISKQTGKFEYSVYSVPLLKDSSGTLQFMNFILGVDKSNKVFITTKQDRIVIEKEFKIYYIPKMKLDKGAYFQLLPVEFLLDSILLNRIDSTQGKYQKAFLHIEFGIKWKDKLDPGRLSTISFKVLDYLSVPLKIDSTVYELCIFTHPLTQSFYNEKNVYWNSEKFLYTVFRTKNEVRDSLVSLGGNFYSLKSKSSDSALYINKSKVFVSKVSSDNTSFFINIVADSSQKEKNFILFPKDHLSKELLSNKLMEVSNIEQHYKLFYFGGSWCKPCTESLPYLKKYAEKFKGKVKLTTVLVDRSEAIAKKYALDYKLASPIFYEPLGRSNFLSTLFSVSEFPTFILVDKDNKILIKSISIDAISSETSKILDLKQ